MKIDGKWNKSIYIYESDIIHFDYRYEKRQIHLACISNKFNICFCFIFSTYCFMHDIKTDSEGDIAKGIVVEENSQQRDSYK